MNNGIYKIEKPTNEPILSYRSGSQEKQEIKAKLNQLKGKVIEIPLIIGGKEVRTGNLGECRVPHDHEQKLAVYHKAGAEEVEMAIEAAKEAKEEWANMNWADRLAIFNKAADLLAGPYRSLINAATMLGQSKNVFQAEIDSACELIDFLRYNTYYATQIYQDQPDSSSGIWNRLDYRPLEGFVFAVTPFNFTSIAGNLPSAPAMLGNTVLWKPASSAVYSAYYFMKLLKEAGVPDGVINFIPGSGAKIGDYVLASPELAGIHFTGSTEVFRNMWKTVGMNIERYNSYPRIVGETGGKDFVFVHESARADITATALVRGAFEYQGQKCSAASRAYIPENLWGDIKNKMLAQMKDMKMGNPEDFTNFINAVIDKHAFDSITGYIDYAKSHEDAEILIGGEYDDSRGYFIEPTVVLAKTPDFKTMREEIFGPVLTIYLYDTADFEATLKICDETSPYGLTGSIFAQEREAIVVAQKMLANAAGNFYINDKPTGAVVGQQPFGGGRASGTNDKAGSRLNLLRWLSPRSIKENYIPPVDYKYPFMEEE